MRKVIFFFSLGLWLILWITTDFSVWENISIVLFVYFFMDFLENLGKKIVVLELINIIASFTCLVMPVVFYHFYTKDNILAKVWVKYMPIEAEDYFSYMVPAIIALAIGLRLPLGILKNNRQPRIYLDNVIATLRNNSNVGLKLIAIGVVSGFLDFLSPASLKQEFYLLAHLTFVGVFYVLYSPNKHKKIVVASVLALMIGQTLIEGMYGELIFILACTLPLVLLGKDVAFTRKLGIATVGIVMILIIQSVKVSYREKIWLEPGGADPAYYAQLVTEIITDPSTMFSTHQLFLTSVRMNQGWLVATTMNKVPRRYNFAYGETIWTSIAAAFIPRFMWTDKPEAGGKANLKRFWGYNLVGYSMNIGPFGEGYANFDRFGGIIYMFCYGLFFNLIFSLLIKYADKRPTIVLWIPFLFYYAVGVETDLFITMGSLMKGLIFMWIIFNVFRITIRQEL